MNPTIKRLSQLSLKDDTSAAHDRRLIDRCRSGDESAWNELVERYQRLIYSIPRRAGLTDEQSADVFQDVLLTLFQKLDEITQPERIRSWLVTTAKFKTWGVIRNSKGFYALDTQEQVDSELASLADRSPLADDMLIELEEQHIIRMALARLEEKCRTIISMIYLSEPPASYAQVGQEIGVGETSISPMRSRCLKKLGKLISN